MGSFLGMSNNPAYGSIQAYLRSFFFFFYYFISTEFLRNLHRSPRHSNHWRMCYFYPIVKRQHQNRNVIGPIPIICPSSGSFNRYEWVQGRKADAAQCIYKCNSSNQYWTARALLRGPFTVNISFPCWDPRCVCGGFAGRIAVLSIRLRFVASYSIQAHPHSA